MYDLHCIALPFWEKETVILVAELFWPDIEGSDRALANSVALVVTYGAAPVATKRPPSARTAGTIVEERVHWCPSALVIASAFYLDVEIHSTLVVVSSTYSCTFL